MRAKGRRTWRNRARLSTIPDIAAGLADFPDGIDDAIKPFKMDFKRVAILSDLHIGLHEQTRHYDSFGRRKTVWRQTAYISTVI